MKYPLRIAAVRERPYRFVIEDANKKVIFAIFDNDPRSFGLARFVVRTANRWHFIRIWFRPYAREDWLWERNIWKG